MTLAGYVNFITDRGCPLLSAGLVRNLVRPSTNAVIRWVAFQAPPRDGVCPAVGVVGAPVLAKRQPFEKCEEH